MNVELTSLEEAYGIHAFGQYPLKTLGRYFIVFDVSGPTCSGSGFLTLAGGRVQLCTNKHMLVADVEEEDRYEYIVLFHWHINHFVYRKYNLWEGDQSLYMLHPSPLDIDVAVLDIGCQSDFFSLALLPQTPFEAWQGDGLVMMGFPGLYDYQPYPRWNQRFALLVPATLSSPPEEDYGGMPYMLASGLSRPGMSGSIVAMYNNCERKFTPIGVNSGQMSLSDGSSSELCIVWQWALVEEMIRLQLSDGNASVEILQHACCQPGVGDVDLAQLMPN